MTAPVRLALIGGGSGSFIGNVHRMAAALDGRFQLVAGIFSRNAERNAARAQEWGVAPTRAYPDLGALIAGEAGRADWVEAIAIATPNDSHFALTRDAIAAGLHVICDKPMTATLDEALALAPLIRGSDRIYALTFTYWGYAMLREARERVRTGALGQVRKVVVDYPQGWLAEPVEQQDNRQAAWRTDPSRAGIGGCIGDIGVHAFHLIEQVSGLRVSSLCSDLPRVVPGRRLDDDCNILLRLGDVPGVLTASQIATGERNGLRLRIYGDRASLAWDHDRPGELRMLTSDGIDHIAYAGSGGLSPAAGAATRLPSGHPEGFVEAFATLYRDFADAVRGQSPGDLPGLAEGVRSMQFITAAVESHQIRRWVTMTEDV